LNGNPDLTHPTRLTENTGGSNSYAAVSPNGKKIVFETTDFEPRKSRC
jgi:Tol biopolymer transport system component